MMKQLKIWQDDFKRYYAKTSLMMRIIIGAFFSFIVAYYAINNHLKPQQLKIKNVNDKLKNIVTYSDPESIIKDLQNTQKTMATKVKKMKKINEKLTEQKGHYLTSDEVGKIILNLRLLIDRNELKIISEDRIKEIVINNDFSNDFSNNVASEAEDTKIKLSLPEFMTDSGYSFKILGAYKNLQKFLLEVYKTEKLFFINNVKLISSTDKITDRNFKDHQAIECHFEIHIPYRKGFSQ